MLGQIDAEVAGPSHDIVSVHIGGEALLFHLFLHARRFQVSNPIGSHQRCGGNEAR
jgi:hypothetical protein